MRVIKNDPNGYLAFLQSLFFLFISFSSLTGQEQLSGSWAGELVYPPYDIPIGLHFNSDYEKLKVFFDNPAQGSTNVQVDSFKVDLPLLDIWLPGIQMSFTLKGDQLDGTWLQGGKEKIIGLKKGAKLRSPLRPQTPKAPFPYFSDTVQFANHSAKIILEGSLTRPNNDDKQIAAVLLTGSGPQDRDETILHHKMFAVIADHLSRNDIAILRFDDRGMGNSEGSHSSANSLDFATDAASAYFFLDSIGYKNIGFIGHSEGGLISPIADSIVNGAAFHVMLAGPAIPIWQLMVEQNRLVLQDRYEEELLESYLELVKEVFLTVKSEGSTADKQEKINRITKAFYGGLEPEKAKEISPSEIAFSMQFSQLLYLRWWTYFLSFEPEHYINRIKAPILAINGSKDIQVTADNLEAITRYAKSSSSVKTVELPDHNHLFQRCQSCTLREYGLLTETVSMETLTLISTWLKDNFN